MEILMVSIAALAALAASAFLGALVLGWLSAVPPILTYVAFGSHLQVSPLKLGGPPQ